MRSLENFLKRGSQLGVLLLTLPCGAWAAQDASAPLTLAEAVQSALAANPQIVGADHTVAGAGANLSGQSKPLNPVAQVTAITHTPGTFVQSDATQFGALFTVETSGRQAIRTRQARAQLQGAKADFETTRQSVVQAVRAAYVGVQLAERDLSIEQASYDDAEKLKTLTEEQFMAGSAPETNAIRANVALAQEAQNLEQAKVQVPLAKAALNVALGREAQAPIEVAESLQLHRDHRPLTELEKLALTHRPEILSAEAAKRGLEANVDFERSQYYPDVTIGADPFAARYGQIEFLTSFPLFDFGSIRASIRQAKEAVKTQEAVIDQTKQGVLLDVKTAYLGLEQASVLVDTFEAGILPRAKSLLEKIQAGYKLGANTILDVLDAEATYRTTQNDYASAIAAYEVATAQLDRALGISPYLPTAPQDKEKKK